MPHAPGESKVAEISPLGEWMHDYKGGETNSRMQLRQLGARLFQEKDLLREQPQIVRGRAQ